MQLPPFVSPIIALVSLTWAFTLALRKGDVFKPAVRTDSGYFDELEINDKAVRRNKRLRRSAMIYMGRLSEGEVGVFLFPLQITNVGRTALRHVRILLSFPGKFAVSESFLKDLEDFPEAKDTRAARHAVLIAEQAQTCFDIPLIRPKERVLLGEPIKFVSRSGCGEVLNRAAQEMSVRERMIATAKVGDYLAMDVVVLAENHQPISERLNIIWLNGDSKDDLEQAIPRIVKSFWGEFPQPGVYLRPFWHKKESRWERADVIIPNLIPAKTRSRQVIKIEQPLKSNIGMAQLWMPTWNYHEQRRPNLEKWRDPLLSKIGGWLSTSTKDRNG